MRDFQKKNKFKHFFRSKPVLILLALFLIVFAWNIFGLVGKMKNTIKNKKIEEQKISDLNSRKTKLLSGIQKLNTDEGKEEVIRENFGMVKDGEGVIVVVDEKEKDGSSTVPESKGFLNFFKNLFK